MTHTIRECRPDDLPMLVQLCANHAAYEKAIYSVENKIEKLWNAIFGIASKLHCWVVESEGCLAGYFSYTFDFSTWDAGVFMHLDCLYLEPAYRGKGIGKEIFNKLLEIAKENNCLNIQWQTPDFNEPAIGFYKRLGAVAADKVRFRYEVRGTNDE